MSTRRGLLRSALAFIITAPFIRAGLALRTKFAGLSGVRVKTGDVSECVMRLDFKNKMVRATNGGKVYEFPMPKSADRWRMDGVDAYSVNASALKVVWWRGVYPEITKETSFMGEPGVPVEFLVVQRV